MANWNRCQKALGVHFNDGLLLQQAFVHSSYLNENPGFALPSSERLEFLGDAILDFIIAEQLYREFPELPEGELTRIRAYLVCRQTLAKVASLLKLGDWLLLGRGEEASGGRKKRSNLADAVEAVIGAIYLDQEMAGVRAFILRQFEPFLEEVRHGEISFNYKALLQELAQSERHSTPSYSLMEAAGPDHDRQFTVGVLVQGEILGRGTGKSKKAAEMEAARLAWENWRYNYGQTRL